MNVYLYTLGLTEAVDHTPCSTVAGVNILAARLSGLYGVAVGRVISEVVCQANGWGFALGMEAIILSTMVKPVGVLGVASHSGVVA